MALNLPGIAGQISGAVQGVEFANSRGRSIMKKAKPHKQTRSPAQLHSDNIQRAAIAHWQGLTDNQRTAWKTAADQKPRPDRFGTYRVLSGFQLFLTIPHDFRFGVPVAFLDDPPIEITGTPFITSLTITAPASIVAGGFFPSGFNYTLSLFISRWMSPTATRAHRNWKKLGLTYWDTAAGPDFSTSLAANNVNFIAGETVAARLQFYNAGKYPSWKDFGPLTVAAP